MLSSLDQAPDVHRKLAALRVPREDLGSEAQAVALIAECFRLSLSRSAIYVLREQFDVHDAEQAKLQPKLFADAVLKITGLFRALVDTPFDAKRSMFDVTTVMVASEFGRTMRAPDMPITDTGTNHNQFANSILLGGKGIRSGLVVGASDLADEKAAPSKAHLAMDPVLEKVMGRPIDLKTLRVRPDQPDTFDIESYLTIGSVVNTLYAMFSVPKVALSQHRAQPAAGARVERAARVTRHERQARLAPRIDLTERLARPASLRVARPCAGRHRPRRLREHDGAFLRAGGSAVAPRGGAAHAGLLRDARAPRSIRCCPSRRAGCSTTAPSQRPGRSSSPTGSRSPSRPRPCSRSSCRCCTARSPPAPGLPKLLLQWSYGFAGVCALAFPVFTQDLWLSAAWGRMIAAGVNPFHTPVHAGVARRACRSIISRCRCRTDRCGGSSPAAVMLMAGDSALLTAVLFKAVLAGGLDRLAASRLPAHRGPAAKPALPRHRRVRMDARGRVAVACRGPQRHRHGGAGPALAVPAHARPDAMRRSHWPRRRCAST